MGSTPISSSCRGFILSPVPGGLDWQVWLFHRLEAPDISKTSPSAPPGTGLLWLRLSWRLGPVRTDQATVSMNPVNALRLDGLGWRY